MNVKARRVHGSESVFASVSGEPLKAVLFLAYVITPMDAYRYQCRYLGSWTFSASL